MKRSLKNLVQKLESDDSRKLGGGFTVLSNLRGGKVVPEPEVGVNDVCTGTNPTGCSNQRQCSGTTNTIGCHNYGTCFSD